MVQEPASQIPQKIHILTGHSGAIVTVRETGGRTVVRKAAGQIAQNARLEAQAGKQARFRELGGPCPAVLASGYEELRFFFDMEYVNGVSVAHECKSGLLHHRDALVAFLGHWIGRYRATAQGELGPQLFLAKLAAIRKASHGNPVLAGLTDEIDRFLDRLGRAGWTGVPRSDCHGDLTLENIIVTKKEFCLIDFDVADLPSYYMDIAKIFQDVGGLWCLRGMEREAHGALAYANARQVLNRLRGMLLAMVQDMEPRLLPLLPRLVALNLMRVLPYCRDAATGKFVLARVGAVLEDETA